MSNLKTTKIFYKYIKLKTFPLCILTDCLPLSKVKPKQQCICVRPRKKSHLKGGDETKKPFWPRRKKHAAPLRAHPSNLSLRATIRGAFAQRISSRQKRIVLDSRRSAQRKNAQYANFSLHIVRFYSILSIDELLQRLESIHIHRRRINKRVFLSHLFILEKSHRMEG